MARLNNPNHEAILDAAIIWRQKCLLNDGSVFSDLNLWTSENLNQLEVQIVNNYLDDDRSFLEKLKAQLDVTANDTKKLAAEMLWIMFLFPSNIGFDRKINTISTIWSWSGDMLDVNLRLLQESLKAGIGGAGIAYNTHRYREIVFFIKFMQAWKKLSGNDKQILSNDPWKFGDWLDHIPDANVRQLRHIILHLLFPEFYERIASTEHKKNIIEKFGNMLAGFQDGGGEISQLLNIDKKIYHIRKELETAMPDKILDFYEPPLRERWYVSSEKRYWVEKTIVAGREDRTVGPHALGKALWSPQTSKDGKDIYKSMKEIKENDVVFHFIDNKGIDGVSIVKSSADKTFMGLSGTEWADVPSYRIELRDYTKLKKNILRQEFLLNEKYRHVLDKLLNEHKGLFFNKHYELNQGAYLTEAPIELVKIWNEIYKHNANKSLPHIDLPEKDIDTDEPVRLVNLGMDIIPEFQKAIEGRLLFDETDVRRFVVSIIAKPFVILTGNSGTGKTKLAQTFVSWLSGVDESRYKVVPVGADWTDNRNVMGFLNLLKKSDSGDALIYQSTPVLDLILQANRDPYSPYFLILDEMNLSHVERYFSDFLSALESGKKIPVHSEEAEVRTSAGAELDREISLPANLFLVGTVNVDETTYMFSPKVLDRANVIELGVDKTRFGQFLSSPKGRNSDFGSAPAGMADALLYLSFRARGIKFRDDIPGDLSELPNATEINAKLLDLFGILNKRSMEFAFRTGMEVGRFLKIDYELTKDKTVWDWKKTLDLQILQKILPKLHGSRRKLEAVLTALAKFCSGTSFDEAVSVLASGATFSDHVFDPDIIPEQTVFPKSYKKLSAMISTVRRDQFVSFIQ